MKIAGVHHERPSPRRPSIDIISVPPAITRSSEPDMIEAAAMLTLVIRSRRTGPASPRWREHRSRHRAPTSGRDRRSAARCELVPQMMSSTSAVSIRCGRQRRNTWRPTLRMNARQRALAALPIPRRPACIDDQRVNHGVSLEDFVCSVWITKSAPQSNFPSGPKNGCGPSKSRWEPVGDETSKPSPEPAVEMEGRRST